MLLSYRKQSLLLLLFYHRYPKLYNKHLSTRNSTQLDHNIKSCWKPPDITCISLGHMVYYIYELRWTSSDNTLKGLDASGSFLYYVSKNSDIVNIYLQKQVIDGQNPSTSDLIQNKVNTYNGCANMLY